MSWVKFVYTVALVAAFGTSVRASDDLKVTLYLSGSVFPANGHLPAIVEIENQSAHDIEVVDKLDYHREEDGKVGPFNATDSGPYQVVLHVQRPSDSKLSYGLIVSQPLVPLKVLPGNSRLIKVNIDRAMLADGPNMIWLTLQYSPNGVSRSPTVTITAEPPSSQRSPTTRRSEQ